MDIKDRYRHASLHVQNVSQSKNTASVEQHRWKLYGFHKQAMSGDCTDNANLILPSNSSLTLKNKYNAWNKCRGMSREEAMNAFIKVVEEIDPSYKYVPGATPKTPSGDMSDKLIESDKTARGSISKKGYMRKKSDWKKNWDSRYFVLSNGKLRYYLTADNADPRMTLLVKECEVMKRQDSVVIENKPFYGMTINHPKSSTQWILMCEKKAERDDWIAVLEDARGTAGASAILQRQSSRTVNENPESNSSKKHGAKSDDSIVFDSPTANIPQEFLPKLEKNINELIAAAETNDGWEDLFSREISNGRSMHAYRKPGDTIMVKGTAVMPYSIKDIFSLIGNIANLPLINPQCENTQKLKVFSATTSTGHLIFKQVWPTAVRDMVNFTHWRIVSGGKLVLVTYNAEDYHSADKIEAVPASKGVVRANLVLGGYVLAPDLKNGTTKVTYVVSSDLRGSIPSSVSNFVAKSQPMIVSAISKYLNSKPTSELSSPKELPTYEDLCNIITSYASNEAKFGIYNSLKSNADTKVGNDGALSNDVSEFSGDSSGKFVFKTFLLVLLLPFLLAYVVEDHRLLAFICGWAICVPYIHSQLLQGHATNTNYYPNNVEFSNALPRGRVLVQFSVDLGKILRYVEGKREEYGMDITLTHVVAKAAANALRQCQDLNGRIIGNTFYRNKSKAIDISVSADYSDMIAVKINSADNKALGSLAEELQAKSRSVRRALTSGAGAGGGQKAAAGTKVLGGGPSSRMGIILDAAPYFVSYTIRYTLRLFASYYGMSFPSLGITPYPHGACNIIATPRDGNRIDGIEIDVGVMMIPETDGTISSPPVVITIGGISLKTSIEQEMGDKKISAAPVLNLAVSVDSRAVGFARGRQFVTILQEFMTDFKDE
jgi:acyl-CoA-binding protein